MPLSRRTRDNEINSDKWHNALGTNWSIIFYGRLAHEQNLSLIPSTNTECRRSCRRWKIPSEKIFMAQIFNRLRLDSAHKRFRHWLYSRKIQHSSQAEISHIELITRALLSQRITEFLNYQMFLSSMLTLLIPFMLWRLFRDDSLVFLSR